MVKVKKMIMKAKSKRNERLARRQCLKQKRKEKRKGGGVSKPKKKRETKGWRSVQKGSEGSHHRISRQQTKLKTEDRIDEDIQTSNFITTYNNNYLERSS